MWNKTTVGQISFLLTSLLVAPLVHTGMDSPQQSKTGPEPPAAAGPKIQPTGASAATLRTISGVPGYAWRHGCGATAVGMVLGYYDTLGFPDLFPGDASTQTTDVSQRIASEGSGVRGTGEQRHFENYSLPNDASGPVVIPDSSVTYPSGCHTDDCIADFMHTSWSRDNNPYGWNWSDWIGPAFTSYVNLRNSAYSPNYRQYRMGEDLTWDVLTEEIDSGRPMVFLVDSDGNGRTDHFVTVVGYNDDPNQQYGCLDTWFPPDQVRWCRFREMSSSYSWGVWGGWSFGLSGENHSPLLSDPSVTPRSGCTSTTFEFLVDYYDADGDPPLPQYAKVLISGIGALPMTLKSGDPANGTYHYKTESGEFSPGNYRYFFQFVDSEYNSVTTNWYEGPRVTICDGVAINVTIHCKYISPCLSIEYSTEGLTGPYTKIPVTGPKLDPVFVLGGSTICFSPGVCNENYGYARYEWYDDTGESGNGESNSWSVLLGPQTTVLNLDVYYNYSPKEYVISGTVLLSDNTPVPGGVNLTLTSPEQTMTLHTDGNFSFTGVLGGISVTITPSAPGYAFSPPNLVYDSLRADKVNQEITAWSSDDYAPMVSLLTVPPTVNDTSAVSFSWAGTDDVSSPTSLQYRWQLEGHDADWWAWSLATSTSYDLPNGSYTFKVTAKDAAGNENQAPASHSFVVNAAPKVASAVRVSQSMWASRVTLEMPSGASHPTSTFVLLPEHSGMTNSDLVPVAIHRPGETLPCGASQIVADQVGVSESIVKAQSGPGWLVTLPESIPDDGQVSYDIVWGKIAYFGWKEFVPVPHGFPNASPGGDYFGYVMDSFLDSNANLWRVANKTYVPAGGEDGWSSWVFMNAWRESRPVTSETLLQFLQGQPWNGSYGSDYECDQGSIVDCGSNVCIMWQEEKREDVLVGSEDENYRYHRYVLRVFDSALRPVNSFDGTFLEDTWITVPSSSVRDRLFVTGKTYNSTAATVDLWFTMHDCQGNEIIPRTVFDSTPRTHWDDLEDYGVKQLGNNVAFLFEHSWETSNGDDRQEVCYQLRTADGVQVKSTVILNGELLPEDAEEGDEYSFDSAVTDGEGKLWVTLQHSQGGQPDECYYCIIGVDGSVLRQPTLRSLYARFRFCDKDGRIWLTEGGNLVVLNSDGIEVFPPRGATWVPDQTVASIATSASPDGYRLYDRWSPQMIEINVPSGFNADSMELFDLNLWGNDLHPANLKLKKADTVVWSQSGQFTGHTTVDLPAGTLAEGGNALTATQDDFLGGQVLFKFPYYASGSLRVTISPQEAVDAGAQWCFDGGGWRDSGETQGGLSVGQRIVEFKDVVGWTTPENQTIVINSGQATEAGATYIATPAVENITYSIAEGVRLTWLSSTGVTYTVQFAEDLTSAWQSLSQLVGTGGAMEWIDDGTETSLHPGLTSVLKRFYRLLAQP